MPVNRAFFGVIRGFGRGSIPLGGRQGDTLRYLLQSDNANDEGYGIDVLVW